MWRRMLFALAVLAPAAVLGAVLAGGASRAPRAGTLARARTLDAYRRLPLAFEPNAGQTTDRRVRFLARGAGYTLGLRRDGALLALYRESGPRAHRHATARVLSLGFPSSSRAVRLTAGPRLPGRVNYLLGPDPRRWYTGVPTFSGASYRGLWPGIDADFRGSQGALEYVFRLAPGADPRDIAVTYRGATSLRLDRHGGALITAGAGRTVRQLAPRAYQRIGGARRPVAGRYVIDGGRVRIRLGAYDHRRPLVIDPTLAYSTYLGGAGDDAAFGVAVDSSGDAYVGGRTFSADFPATGGARQTANGGHSDAFVTELAPDGRSVAWSTYLGGSGDDAAFGLGLDSAGDPYVTGSTTSTDFPTHSAAQAAFGGGSVDGFVTKLNAGGASLAWSTYLGGSDSDNTTGIAVDSSGNAYVSGSTWSTNFPTVAAAQGTQGGSIDAFAAKFGSTGTLSYSTFLGGSGADTGTAIAVDSAGSAYVTGTTTSTGRATAGAYETTPDKGFVTRLLPRGAVAYSTYIGAGGSAIGVDSAGAAYVAGAITTGDLPTTSGAFQIGAPGGGQDAFALKLDPSGSTLGYATYLGGSGGDIASAIAVDPSGAAWVTGATTSSDFPTTADAPQQTHATGGDVYVTELNAAGSAPVFSTYLGGAGAYENGLGITVDAAGAAYVVGDTNATNFPVTTGAYRTTAAGGDEAFAAKLAPTGGSGGGTGGGGGSGGGSSGGPGGGDGTTGGSGGSGTGGGSPRFGPPLARVVSAPARVLRHGMWFNGAASLVDDGDRVVDYSWALDGRHPNWDCGGAAAMTVAFARPGVHTVGLRVTDLAGQVATVQQQVTVPRGARGPLPGVTTYDCENPAAGNQPDRADCVKSFGFGIVDVNSRGAKDDCFEIVSRIKRGLVTGGAGAFGKAQAAASRILDFTATLHGPVALNGLYLPVPEAGRSVYDSGLQTVDIGHVDVKLGSLTTIPVSLLHKSVVPNGQGVAHLADLELPGKPKVAGLPIGGSVSVDLTPRASRTKVHATLPIAFTLGDGKPAQGDLFLISDNVHGLRIDGAQLGPLDAFLGPVYVQNLAFRYLASSNLWEGGAKLTLPGASFAIDASPVDNAPDLGFGIRDGEFDHAGFQIDFQPPAQPELFPGVALSHLGGAFGVRPVRLTGTAGITAGEAVAIDGVALAAFASPDQPYTIPDDPGPQLAPLAGRRLDSFSLALAGTAKIQTPYFTVPLAHAYGLYEYPDFFEVGAGFTLDLTFAKVEGQLGGFVLPSERTFSFDAQSTACPNFKVDLPIVGEQTIDKPCYDAGMALSTAGAGLCGSVPIPFFTGAIPVTVTVGVRWGHGPHVALFTCDLAPYEEANPRAARAAGARARASAADAWAFTLPSGLPSAMVRVAGRGGEPDVTLAGPGGARISTASPPANPNVIVLRTGGETLIALKRPPGGTWTVTASAGSAPVTGVASANGLPAPRIAVRVSGRGARRTLTYRAQPQRGRTITFAERSSHVARVLGTAHGASGRIRFTPAPGPAEGRTIVALVSDDGVPQPSLRLATYRAPGPPRLRRPARLRLTRRGALVTARWRPVPGAARYAVTLVSASGGRTMTLARRATIRLRAPAGRATVFVNALSAANAHGPAARGRVPAAPRHRPKPHRTRRRRP